MSHLNEHTPMTAVGHYREADRLLARAASPTDAEEEQSALVTARALAHATLAAAWAGMSDEENHAIAMGEEDEEEEW